MLHTLLGSSQAESCSDLWGRNSRHQNKSEPQKLIKRLFSSWYGNHNRTRFRHCWLSLFLSVLSLFSVWAQSCNLSLSLSLPLPMFCFPDFSLELSTFEQSRTRAAGSQNNSNSHMRASAWTGPAHDPERDCNSDTMTSWSTGEKACSQAKQTTYSTKQTLSIQKWYNWHTSCLLLLLKITFWPTFLWLG